MIRTLALLALVAVTFAGCARAADDDTAKKLVGKWKVTVIDDMKQDTSLTLLLEFKKDGTGAMSIEAADPKSAEFVEAFNEKAPAFKWALTGEKLELTNAKKGVRLFGGEEKGTAKIKIDGDNMTMTPDDEKEKVILLEKVKK
jgi:hypothetical protein